MKASCVIFVCKHLVRFFEKHARNLNTPQNNSASWDLQMGFNSAFKGLKATGIPQLVWKYENKTPIYTHLKNPCI